MTRSRSSAGYKPPYDARNDRGNREKHDVRLAEVSGCLTRTDAGNTHVSRPVDRLSRRSVSHDDADSERSEEHPQAEVKVPVDPRRDYGGLDARPPQFLRDGASMGTE